MRLFVLFTFLASLTWSVAGCGGPSSTPPPADSHLTPGSPNVPGVPTDGPEAQKAKSPRRR